MSDSKKTHTDPRIVRTRQLIKDAFVDLLQEMDVEKMSVNRIAERATINRVTFYLHYRDIPDMMDKLADEMIEGLEGAIAPPGERSGEEQLVRLLEHIAGNAKWYKVVLASRKTTIFSERMLTLMLRLVTNGIEQRGGPELARTGIQKDIAIWYTASALIGTIISWLRKDMPYTPRFLAEQFTLIRNRGT